MKESYERVPSFGRVRVMAAVVSQLSRSVSGMRESRSGHSSATVWSTSSSCRGSTFVSFIPGGSSGRGSTMGRKRAGGFSSPASDVEGPRHEHHGVVRHLGLQGQVAPLRPLGPVDLEQPAFGGRGDDPGADCRHPFAQHVRGHGDPQLDPRGNGGRRGQRAEADVLGEHDDPFEEDAALLAGLVRGLGPVDVLGDDAHVADASGGQAQAVGRVVEFGEGEADFAAVDLGGQPAPDELLGDGPHDGGRRDRDVRKQ